MKFKILISLFFLFPFTLIADNVGYEVEVIIFEDLTDRSLNSEKWYLAKDDTINIINHVNKSSSNSKGFQDPVYEELSTEKSRLHDQIERLVKHNNYNILIHKAWKQTGLDPDKAFQILIDSRNLAFKTDMPAETRPPYITGDITLIMSRYLHINANLIYYKPQIYTASDNTNPANITDTYYNQYPVIFERRMRSKEIHYIDHPLIGMIVLTVPFKVEQEITINKSILH